MTRIVLTWNEAKSRSKQREELRALAELPDDRIDTSDLPPLTDAQLARMVRGRFYRPVKQQITARLDADVLDWLKAGGPGYQSRMNAILRAAMLRER
jgi:uncharacterized protein (DUF4415 family)